MRKLDVKGLEIAGREAAHVSISFTTATLSRMIVWAGTQCEDGGSVWFAAYQEESKKIAERHAQERAIGWRF